jgi:hypothetical protein
MSASSDVERRRPFGCLTVIGIFFIMIGAFNFREWRERYREWSTAPRVTARVVGAGEIVPRGRDKHVYRYSISYQDEGESRDGYIERQYPTLSRGGQVEVIIYKDGEVEEVDALDDKNPYASYWVTWTACIAIGLFLILAPLVGAFRSRSRVGTLH